MSWQGEVVNKRKDGTLIDTSLTVSPLLDASGQLTHFVGIFRDMTERKHIEAPALSGPEDAERRHPGRRRGSRVQQPARRHSGYGLGLREKDTKETVRQFLDRSCSFPSGPPT